MPTVNVKLTVGPVPLLGATDIPEAPPETPMVAASVVTVTLVAPPGSTLAEPGALIVAAAGGTIPKKAVPSASAKTTWRPTTERRRDVECVMLRCTVPAPWYVAQVTAPTAKRHNTERGPTNPERVLTPTSA